MGLHNIARISILIYTHYSMKIAILGAGLLGSLIARELIAENRDVIIIEKTPVPQNRSPILSTVSFTKAMERISTRSSQQAWPKPNGLSLVPGAMKQTSCPAVWLQKPFNM